MRKMFKFLYLLNEPWLTWFKDNWKALSIISAIFGFIITQGMLFLQLFPCGEGSICGNCGGDHKKNLHYFLAYMGIPILEVLALAVLALIFFVIYGTSISLWIHCKKCWRQL